MIDRALDITFPLTVRFWEGVAIASYVRDLDNRRLFSSNEEGSITDGFDIKAKRLGLSANEIQQMSQCACTAEDINRLAVKFCILLEDRHDGRLGGE